MAALVQKALGESTVKQVLCFGLGDFCVAVPGWLKEEYGSRDQSYEGKDVQHPVIQRSMFQHSMALAIAQLCGGNASLLTQDPQYAKLTEDILTQKAFKIIGTHGAGGFAEVDEKSIIISPYVTAPVKQIIADVARPLLIISLGIGFCDDEE